MKRPILLNGADMMVLARLPLDRPFSAFEVPVKHTTAWLRYRLKDGILAENPTTPPSRRKYRVANRGLVLACAAAANENPAIAEIVRGQACMPILAALPCERGIPSICDVVGISTPTLAFHLRPLWDSGIVRNVKPGQYALDRPTPGLRQAIHEYKAHVASLGPPGALPIHVRGNESAHLVGTIPRDWAFSLPVFAAEHEGPGVILRSPRFVDDLDRLLLCARASARLLWTEGAKASTCKPLIRNLAERLQFTVLTHRNVPERFRFYQLGALYGPVMIQATQATRIASKPIAWRDSRRQTQPGMLQQDRTNAWNAIQNRKRRLLRKAARQARQLP